MHRAALLWLVTASPMKTLLTIEIVAEPTVVHWTPSPDSDAVTRFPLRDTRTHTGAAIPERVVPTALPAVERRRWNAAPLEEDTSMYAYDELVVSVSRIITPAFDQTLEFPTFTTRAVTWPSPESGR